MSARWVPALIGLAGCFASSGPSEEEASDARVDQVYDLEEEIRALECECAEARGDDGCDFRVLPEPSKTCIKNVVRRHRDAFAPLIECTLQALGDLRTCLMDSACQEHGGDFDCEHIDPDCDDDVAEMFEDELRPCTEAVDDDNPARDASATDATNGIATACGNGTLDVGEPCDVINGAAVFGAGFNSCAAATDGERPIGTLGCDALTCRADLTMCAPM